MISRLRTAIAVLIVRPATWLKSIAMVAILATVTIGVSAGPALADGYPYHHHHHHYPVPVGSIAGGLGVAAIAGIGLLVAQRRWRRRVSTQP
jgi:hypothetical protein